jgi:hypothetical protein
MNLRNKEKGRRKINVNPIFRIVSKAFVEINNI